jgi:hypothetical protein
MWVLLLLLSIVGLGFRFGSDDAWSSRRPTLLLIGGLLGYLAIRRHLL